MSAYAAASGQKADAPVQQRLDGLEALRGVCALIVLFGHAASLTGTAWLAIRMHLAVDLFFMLSGYVMARSYEHKLRSGMDVGDFLKARIVRLWPTMAIGVALGFVLVASWDVPGETFLVLLCNLLFIPLTSGGGHVFPIVPVTWSIYFELFANLVHAVILRRLRLPALAAIVLAAGAMLLIFQRSANPGGMGADFVLGFPRVLYAYGAGILLWRVLRDRAMLPVWPALVGLVAFMIYSHFQLAGVWIDWLFVFGLAPACMLCGLGRTHFAPLFRFLGALSFPLYAVHGPVLIFMTSHGFGMIASIAAGLAAACLTLRLTAVLRLPSGALIRRHREAVSAT